MNIFDAIKQKWGKLNESWRFAIIAFTVARVSFAIWSWIILTVQPIAVHYVGETNAPVVVFLDLHTSRTFGYSRQVNGNSLTFQPVNRTSVTDMQSNSIWDISTGTAVDGTHKGFKLSPASFPVDLLNWVVVILFIFLLVKGQKKIPLEYSLYTAVSLLILLVRIVDTQPLISMSRYALTLSPSFFILGQAGKNPWSCRLIIYSFIGLNMFLSSEFFSWG